jgi:hypothetical protein
MPEPKVLDFDVLCGECSRLFNEPCDSEYTQNFAGKEMGFFKKPYHTIASLRKAASDGCHLCSLFRVEAQQPSDSTNRSEDDKMLATMMLSKFHPDGEGWELGVRSGQESIGYLKLIPVEGFSSSSYKVVDAFV